MKRAGTQKQSLAKNFPILIFISSLLIRFFYIIQMRTNDPFFYNLMSDALQYHQLALAVLKDGIIGTEPFYHPPLYQYFVALIYATLGPNPLMVRIVQSFLGSANVLLVYYLSRRYFNETTARIAGIISTLYPLLIFFDGEILKPTFFTFLILCGFLLLGRPQPLSLIFAGFVFGLAAITTQNVLIFVLSFPLYLLIRYKNLVIKYLLLFWAGALLMILPVTLRNIIVLREPIPISWQGGVNFYIGNNPQATGITGIPPGSTKRDWYSAYLELKKNFEDEVGHSISASEFDRLCYQKGIEFIIKEPLKTVARLIKKFYLFFAGFEISSERDIYFTAQYSFLKFILFKLPFLQFPFGILLPLGLVGIYYARQRWREMNHLLLFLILYSVSFIVFFVNSRYRMAIIPILIIFAAYALYSFFLKKNRNRLRPGIVIFVGAAILFNANLYRITDPGKYLTQFQIAYLHFSEGRYERALSEVLASIRDNPDFAEAYNLLGLILKNRGSIEQAEQAFLKTVSIDDQFLDAYINLGNIAVTKGKLSEAENLYKKALAIDSLAPTANNNLGNLYFQNRLYDEALKYYTRALQKNPEYTSPLYHAALIYQQLGKIGKAESLCLEVLKIDPFHKGARRIRMRHF